MPSPTVVLHPSVVTLAELRAGGPAAESIAPLVVDADVAPDACGLPRAVAIAVFWPLVVAEEGDVARIVASRAVTVRRADDDALPVGLRAHLVSGEAVRVHPLVARLLADRRALHDVVVRGLWSDAAVAERAAMAPWRASADRRPEIRSATWLGLLELTRDGAAGDARVYANDDELTAAWEDGLVAHDALVRARIEGRRTTTTAGRVWLWRALPPVVRFAAVDRAFDHVALDALIDGLGAEARWRMLAALDDAASRWLARCGLSVCLDDLRPSATRDAVVDETFAQVRRVAAQLADGVITEREHHAKVVDIWANAVHRCDRPHHRPAARNLVRSWFLAGMLPTSGERRLVDLHGLVRKPPWDEREVHERPVLGSPARGFDAHDAVTIAAEQRADAVRFAAPVDDARALVRSLAPALLAQRVTVDDCGTTRGASALPWTAVERELNSPRGTWVAGRVLAEDVRGGDGALLAAAGTTLDAAALLALRDAGPDVVRVRSPRTCEAAGGVCARCWGLDETGAFPAVGDGVGAKALLAWRRSLVLGATLRTFHVGC